MWEISKVFFQDRVIWVKQRFVEQNFKAWSGGAVLRRFAGGRARAVLTLKPKHYFYELLVLADTGRWVHAMRAVNGGSWTNFKRFLREGELGS